MYHNIFRNSEDNTDSGLFPWHYSWMYNVTVLWLLPLLWSHKYRDELYVVLSVSDLQPFGITVLFLDISRSLGVNDAVTVLPVNWDALVFPCRPLFLMQLYNWWWCFFFWYLSHFRTIRFCGLHGVTQFSMKRFYSQSCTFAGLFNSAGWHRDICLMLF